MAMRSQPLFFFFAISWVGIGGLEAGEVMRRLEIPQSEGPVQLEADTITVDHEKRSIEAYGNVRVTRGGTVVTADRLEFDQKTEEAFAQGAVVLKDPAGEIKAHSMRLRLPDETGTILNGNIYIESNRFRIVGRKFEKFQGQRYRINDGEFTTCSCALGPNPWKLTAKELELTPEGTGIVRGATFHILDLPVLYIPKAFYPVRTERQSGFLFPKIGASSKDGFKGELPFYWARSPSGDATIALSVQTKTRTGLLAEWRQMFSQESRSESIFSFYNEGQRTGKSREETTKNIQIDDPNIPVNRGSFSSKNSIGLGGGWKGYSDIFMVSDDLFLREVREFSLDPGEERDAKTRRFSESRLGAWKSWGSYALQGEASYFQDYVEEDDSTIQRLPSVRFFGRQSLGGTPIELRLRTEATHFSRRESAKGFRGDLNPKIVVPIGYGDYFHGSLSGALRETVYQLDRELDSGRGKDRQLVEIRGKLGTVLERVFWREEGRAFKHTVEPEIEYLYVPAAKQRDLPLFDEIDRINRRNQVTYSIKSRFLLRPNQQRNQAKEEDPVASAPQSEETVEALFLRLAQNYDFRGEQEEKRERLSDIDLEARLRPSSFASLGLTSTIDLQLKKLKALSVRLSLWDPRPPSAHLFLPEMRRRSQLDLSYRFVTNHSLSELDTNLRLKIHDYLGLALHSTYDVNGSRFLRNRGGLRLISRCDCWVIDLALGRTTNPDKTEFLAQVTLAGLGTAGKDPFR
jgi:LPS-assembly protein